MVKVGGEVDSLCTKCQMTLAHTVIAMVDGRPVKVECNTCHGVHRFRGESPGDARGRPARSPATRAPRERPITQSFDEALRSRNLAAARRYSPRESYDLDQIIEHPAFGLGWVSAVRDVTRIEVTFRNEVKLLVQGKI
jgi:hypothetical protein